MIDIHILIVEDEDNMRKSVVKAVEGAGYRVTQAADGETAIALLDEAAAHKRAYDIVISDIVMYEVSGVQVMQAALRQPYEPEVILLTGQGSMETAIEAVRSGAFDYLLKPCPVQTLRQRIRAALEHREHRLQEQQALQTLRSLADTARGLLAGDEQASALMERNTQTEKPTTTSAPAQSQAHDPDRYLQVGELRVDRYRHEIWFKQRPVDVTPIEYAMLSCLATSPGRAIPFSDIAECTHGKRLKRGDARILLASHIYNLRTKIDRRYIVNVAGVGYMLTDPAEEYPPEE
jgi:DNA-binding response OmpR family regulator